MEMLKMDKEQTEKIVNNDNWQMVEDSCNVFKYCVCEYRRQYNNRRDDGWLMGWCLGHLHWLTDDNELIIERVTDGLRAALEQRGK